MAWSCSLVVGAVSLVGLVSSYARMAGKVAHYNSLRTETDTLRARYERLQKDRESNQYPARVAANAGPGSHRGLWH